LDGVTFDVPPGQFCVVLGPSGAGKSTLLRSLNGLTAPSGGRVLVDDVEVGRRTLKDLRPRIGMVYQGFNLVTRASVASNVAAGALAKIGLARAVFGFPPRWVQDKACALLAGAGLKEEHLRRRASALSGGQQQRVGIARALMLDPEIILADEPVASLDPGTSAEILHLIRREAKARGATVLCSLHQIDLALDVADRIVALKAGRVVFDDAPKALTPEIRDLIYDRTSPLPAKAALTAPPSLPEPARESQKPATAWRFPKPYGLRTFVLGLLAVSVLLFTGGRVEMDRMVALTAQALPASLGGTPNSQVTKGFSAVAGQLWPLQIEERTETGRIEGFDPRHLPKFSRLETTSTVVQTLNPDTLKMDRSVERTQVLVQPFGYLAHVGVKLFETVEIALWGTVLAMVIGFPLALLSARNLTPHPLVAAIARAMVSLCRAIPELISALFLVLAYGFGPIAGVLALAVHAAGFLGKFYAEDIENADPAPQEALIAAGAGRLKMLRYAILPQVAPQYIAYTLYILDRNVRMATVIGLVGAGGIGQELKGRYDLYDYHHVGTILVAIFLLVFALDQLASRLRGRLL
jgi:phosphonate transport system permease protein